MRVVLDTNVIIAAFATRGLCSEVFQVCVERHHVVLSNNILSEVKEKLAKKINLPQHIIKDIILYLSDISELVEPSKLERPVCRDKKDDMVIETALSGNADCIITGDQDLLVLKKHKKIEIITPRTFWNYSKA